MEKDKPKIAIIHEYLLKVGGAEKVLLQLHQIFPDAPIFTFLYDEKKTKGMFSDCKIITSSLQKRPLLNKKPRLFLSAYPRVVEDFDLSNFDIVISNSNSFAHGVITKPNTMHICYCHSPMRYAWDWYHEYLDENRLSNGLKSFFVRMALHKIRIWDQVSSERVDYWIANSNNVADRIRKYYKKNSTVIYPGVNIEMIKKMPKASKREEQFIIVSRLEPYKKIELAIEAFNKNEKKLLVIGEGSYRNYLEKIANNNITFLGWRNDEDVYLELSRSKAFIFPGEEDFGITPIEAMACGCPVIAFARGGTLETVISGKTGEFFNESTAENLQGAIEKFELNSYSDKLCKEQAGKFSSDVFSKKIKAVIDKLRVDYANK